MVTAITGQPPKLNFNKPDAIYFYDDQYGERHYSVRRVNYTRPDGSPDKDFRQFHWDGQTWLLGRNGKEEIPYRLKELVEASPDAWVLLCEGEKDADNLAKLGFVTTTHAGGVESIKKALPALKRYLTNRRVAIMQHNDEAGATWANRAAVALYPLTSEVKVITPTFGGWNDKPKGDPSDMIATLQLEEMLPDQINRNFRKILQNTPTWQPPKESEALPESPEVESEPEPNKPPALIFQPLTFQELLARPAKKWLIKDIIGPGDLGMIFGDSGTGKTFLVIDLIMSAITGLSWARHFEVTEPLTVAYCTNEGLSSLPDRFRTAQEWHKASDEALERFTFYPMLPQLFDADAALYILRFVKDYKATKGDQLDLLLLDTLDNASLGSRENDNSDASLIADATRIARDSLGCATILMHHAGKSGEYRGPAPTREIATLC